MIEVHVDATVELEVREVWPDGDAPDVITAEAVADKLAADARSDLCGVWGLLMLEQRASATVRVEATPPAYPQDMLPGMPEPKAAVPDVVAMRL